jgi:hypothetical protein
LVKENDPSYIIEQGDIFFSYRSKVNTEEVKDIKNVQGFYMVLSREGNNNDCLDTTQGP